MPLPDNLWPYQNIVNRLIANDPDDRFQDAQKLIDAIDAFLAGKVEDSAGDTAPNGNSYGERYIHSHPGRRRASQIWGWGISLGVVFTVAVMSWIVIGNTPPPWLSNGSAPEEARQNSDETYVSIDNQKITRLLDIARAHLAVGRLTEPPGANALEAYTMVLQIDPDNEQAKLGLRRVGHLAAEEP